MFVTNDLKDEMEAPVVEIDSCGSDVNTYPVAPGSPSETGSISSSSPETCFLRGLPDCPLNIGAVKYNDVTSGLRPKRGLSLNCFP